MTTRCGGTADVAACEHFARIEDPEVIEHYRCYETAPCDALAECEPERDAGRAREVCGALEECARAVAGSRDKFPRNGAFRSARVTLHTARDGARTRRRLGLDAGG